MAKYPWSDEPTPQTDALHARMEAENERTEGRLDPKHDYYDWLNHSRDLERRLRHAARLLGTIRVDCMLDGSDGTLDPELLEQRLGELEEVFDSAQPT